MPRGDRAGDRGPRKGVPVSLCPGRPLLAAEGPAQNQLRGRSWRKDQEPPTPWTPCSGGRTGSLAPLAPHVLGPLRPPKTPPACIPTCAPGVLSLLETRPPKAGGRGVAAFPRATAPPPGVRGGRTLLGGGRGGRGHSEGGRDRALGGHEVGQPTAVQGGAGAMRPGGRCGAGSPNISKKGTSTGTGKAPSGVASPESGQDAGGEPPLACPHLVVAGQTESWVPSWKRPVHAPRGWAPRNRSAPVPRQFT